MKNNVNFSEEKCTLSIISHGQGHLISYLLDDLERLNLINCEIILTINIQEDELFWVNRTLNIQVIRNLVPKGFGENNNNAFNMSTKDFFIIVNPDIRITELDFSLFLSPFRIENVGAVAPRIFNSSGVLEDSARKFPSISRMLARKILGAKVCDYSYDEFPVCVDWLAGMFVAYRREAYLSVRGFDQRFFMYLEDVDICKRMRLLGWEAKLNPRVQLIHDAQRASKKSLKYFKWHLISFIRYYTGY